MLEMIERSLRKKSQVIVADDDPIMRKLVASQFSSVTTDVTEAADGTAAWHLIKSREFELALVDIEMPNLNGFDLIRCIRSYPTTKHMAVVVITSREESSVMKEALEAGATSFLVKPVNWSMFKPHVENLLRLTQAAKLADSHALDCQEAILTGDRMLSELSHDLSSVMDSLKNLSTRLTGLSQTDQSQGCAVLLNDVLHQMQKAHNKVGATKQLQYSIVHDRAITDKKPAL